MVIYYVLKNSNIQENLLQDFGLEILNNFDYNYNN